MYGDIAICAGRSSQKLCEKICRILGVEPEPVDFVQFSNGNLMVDFHSRTVREQDVFVIQSGARSLLQDKLLGFGQISGDILELLQMMYAIKDSAGRMTAVTPYFPYARSDKKDRPRIAISAKMMFDLLEAVRADRVLTMTLHCQQSVGFSNKPVDQLHADSVFLDVILSLGQDNYAFIAPDSGSILNNDFLAMHTARNIREDGKTPDIVTGYVKKVRVDDSETPHVRTIEGVENLDGRIVIINDDEVLSAKSLGLSANIAMERGAKEVHAFVTHGILSKDAIKRVEESNLTKLYITDTVEFDIEKAENILGKPLEKIEILSVARVFAEAIKRIHEGRSLSTLFLGK